MDQAAFAQAIRDRISAADIAAQWTKRTAGTQTRYAVIDDFLPKDCARKIFSAFLSDSERFDGRSSFREKKRTSVRFDDLLAILRDITFAFQSPAVAELIAERLGIAGISGDPTLYAGGLSAMRKGDFLNPHIDNSHEATRTRYRRVNLLYYVTPDYPVDAGGNLELWDDAVTRPVTLHARFNRLILMETNRHSWHSVSPVQSNVARYCVSNYYFSPESPDGTDYYHVTSFTGRPEQRALRAFGMLDNGARQLARAIGARRAADRGYVGAV